MGPFAYVSGTTAAREDVSLVSADDPYAQTVRALGNVRVALEKAGARLSDVTWTRSYVTNIGNWEEVGRVHGEFFGEIRLATSMVEVSRLSRHRCSSRSQPTP